ncbi:hypothetical protein D3C84_520130 [compost metagenome]
MPFGIAIVGINTDQLRRPGALRCGDAQSVAQLKLESARQLLAEHHRVVARQLLPGGIALSREQRPVLAIGPVIDHPMKVRRPALQGHRDLPARQHRSEILLHQPRLQFAGLRWIAGGDVQLGDQPLLQPVAEGLAKAGGHAARPDIGGQRQQQGHQGQAQGRQLLTAIGNKPLAEHRMATAQGQIQRPIEQYRQTQCGPQHQGRHQHKTTAQAVPPRPREHADQRHDNGHPSLAPQPAPIGLMPGLRGRQRQQRQACGTQQAVDAGQSGAQQAQADAAQPPPGAEAQLPRHFGAVQSPQAGSDVRQQDTGQQVAADHPDQPAEQGQPTQFKAQAQDQHPCADPAGAQGSEQAAALLQCQANRRVDNEQTDDE